MSNNNRTLGTILTAVAAIWLLAQVFGGSFWAVAWPLAVLLPGAALLYVAFRGEQAHTALALSGSSVVGTGLILTLLNISGDWEAWAYAWTLYPVFAGMALYMAGKQNGDADLQKNGQRTLTGGLYAFVGFAFFFEVLIFGGGFNLLTGTVLPLLLLIAGLYLLVVGKLPFIGGDDGDDSADDRKSKRKSHG